MKLLVAVSTRADFYKIEPLIKYWDNINFQDYDVLLTDQHKEFCNSLRESWAFKHKIINPDNLHINILKNRLDDVICQGLRWMDLLDLSQYNCVIVQGDVSSSLSIALSAFHNKIPVAHIEAGLRSFSTFAETNNNTTEPYPEDATRKMISTIASFNFCPTDENSINLIRERVPGEIFITGQSGLDDIRQLNLKPKTTNKIICTLHRRENQSELKEWFLVLDKLASIYTDYSFILPIHKNPEIYKYKETFKHVKCIDPLNHDEMIKEISECFCIVTDSGGCCEEASFFGRIIHLCRQKTERPEAEEFYIQSSTPNELCHNFISFMNDKEYYFNELKEAECPFITKELASKQITDILIDKGIIKLP